MKFFEKFLAKKAPPGSSKPAEKKSDDGGFNLSPNMAKGARLNRKVVAVALAGISLLVIFSLIKGFAPPTPKTAEKKDKKELVAKKAIKPENLANAPKSYQDIEAFLRSQLNEGSQATQTRQVRQKRSKIPATPQAAPQIVANPEDLSKRYGSPIFFQNFKNANKKLQNAQSNSGLNQPNATSTGAAAGGGVMSPQQNEDALYTQNMQEKKQDFLAAQQSKASKIYLSEQLQEPVSPYELVAGSIIPTALITGINTDLPGQIIGQVRENVYDSISGNHLIIPQGTKLLGQYDSVVSYGQERVLIAWEYLIFPNGKSLSLRGMQGADLSGFTGVKDKVNNHYIRTFASVILSSIISVAATNSTGNAQGENPSDSSLYGAGISTSASSASNKLLDRNLNIQPTLTVRPGHILNVLVNKTLVLEPYIL